MKEEFAELLKSIDLSPTQIKIYLSVLKNGLSTVLDIYTDTKITRSQIYADSNILIQKGILELASRKKRKFLAVLPNKLDKIISEKNSKLKSLRESLDEASSFYTNKHPKSSEYNIKIYEGFNQVKRAIEFQLEDSKGTILDIVVGDTSGPHNLFSREYWDKWHATFTRFGGNGRMIIDKESSFFKYYQDKNRDSKIKTRGLSKFLIQTNFATWKNKVLITIFTDKPVSMLIESAILSNSYREIFNQLWNVAE